MIKNQNTIRKTEMITICGIMNIEEKIITVEIDGETKYLSDLLKDFNDKNLELTVISSGEIKD